MQLGRTLLKTVGGQAEAKTGDDDVTRRGGTSPSRRLQHSSRFARRLSPANRTKELMQTDFQ